MADNKQDSKQPEPKSTNLSKIDKPNNPTNRPDLHIINDSADSLNFETPTNMSSIKTSIKPKE